MYVTVLTSLIVASLCSKNDISTAKFSQYGLSDSSRNHLDGADHGDKSKIQCSRVCAFNDDCLAFQHNPSGGARGKCVLFPDYTVSRKLEASNGSRYYEKRQCVELLHVDAGLVYSDYTSPMFSGLYVRLTRFLLSGSEVTGQMRLGHVPISSIYPGFSTTVDAALEMPGFSPSRTILIKGTREYCYERTSASPLAFTRCQDTSYFAPFFTQTGLNRIDAATVVDVANRDVHVFANDVVYHLHYNAGTRKFDLLATFDILNLDPDNPWCNTTFGLTAVLRLTDKTFYLFEGAKYFSYDIVSRTMTSVPLIVCD